MKKKSVLAIAIIAVVAVVASVSFAAWNAIVASQDLVKIDVADRVNINLAYTEADVETGTKLAPQDGDGSTVIIANGAKVVRSIELGTFTATFKNASETVNVDSHKITVTISGLNANLQYTLTPATGTPIDLTSASDVADVVIGTKYTISVSFIETAGKITEENAAAVANKDFGATLTFDAVLKGSN